MARTRSMASVEAEVAKVEAELKKLKEREGALASRLQE